jgi:hypothetical protein
MKNLILFNLFIFILIGCSENSNKKNQESASKISESNKISPIGNDEFRINRALTGQIGSYSKKLKLYNNSCAETIRNLFVEVKLWPESSLIDECLEFIPEHILFPKNWYLKKDGIFLYTVHKNISHSDTTILAETYYFDNEKQVLIPVFLSENNLVIIDSLFEINLPFKNYSFECGHMNLDSVTRENYEPGIWQMVNENHEKIKR